MKRLKTTIKTISYFVPFIALMFLFACSDPMSQAGSESGGDGSLSLATNPDAFQVVQNAQLLVVAPDLADNDADSAGGSLTVMSVANAVGGTVEKSGDTISFTSTGYAGDPAGFEYVVQNAQGIEATGTVNITVTPLTPIEAYIYPDAGSVATKIASYVPLSAQVIFDSWGRFDRGNFYADKDAAVGNDNASAWVLNTDPDGITMPEMVSSNGLVSTDKLENYTFEATLSSDDSGNDTIGLVIAFVRDGDTNYTLSAVRNKGGNSPDVGWGVCYRADDGDRVTAWLIDSKSVDGTAGGWSGDETRVKIERNGDIVKVYTTNWNDVNTYQASSEIVIDLDSDEDLYKFKGAQSYGYLTDSQPGSTYLDIQMGGNLDGTKIYNAADSKVWEYIQGSGWTELVGTTVQQDLGFDRMVTNPETDETYLIQESSITLQ